MRNFWLIARNEFIKKATNRGFWLASLSLPVLILVVMAVAILFALKPFQNSPIGYVDPGGLLKAGAWQPQPGSHVQLIAYADETAARGALEKGAIQGYYLVPANFLTSLELQLYYRNTPPGPLQKDDFTAFLRAGLTAGFPEGVRTRLAEGPQLLVRSSDGSKELAQGNFVGLMLPFIAGILLILINMASAGTLLQVVADEKENRTIEVMLTSISPEQLIGGKVIGLLGITVTQLLIWSAAIAAGIGVGGLFYEPLRNAKVSGEFILLALVFFLPTYAMIAGVMTAIGGSVTDVSQGQQISGLINMVFMLPLILSALIILNPNSPLVVILTLFPTTAFATIILRWGFAVIPAWQLALSWVLLAATATLFIWGSARIFRMGMLKYGNPLDFRTALGSLWRKAE